MSRRPNGRPRRRPSRAALATIGLGLGLALAALEAAPLPGPPLYDGVIPTEAYRWLTPPPGQHGGAQGASQVIPVSGGTSPLVAVATSELTPQAQIFAAPGALVLPPGTTSLTVSITPVEPANVPTVGSIAGNVYRITLVNQAGVAATALASAQVSVVLRSPDPTATEGTVSLDKASSWQPLKTEPPGLGATFVAVVTEFGDFALIQAGPVSTPAGSSEPSTGPPASGGPTPVPSLAPSGPDSGVPPVTILALAAILLVLAGLAISAFMPRRRRRAAPVRRPPPRIRR